MQCNRFVYNVYTWNFQVENVYITMEDPERSELVPWQALTSCVGHNRPRTNEKAAQNRISITIFSPLSQSINALARDYPWRVLKNAGLPIRRTLAHSPSPQICLRSANRSNRRLICVPLLVLGALKSQEGRGNFCRVHSRHWKQWKRDLWVFESRPLRLGLRGIQVGDRVGDRDSLTERASTSSVNAFLFLLRQQHIKE